MKTVLLVIALVLVGCGQAAEDIKDALAPVPTATPTAGTVVPVDSVVDPVVASVEPVVSVEPTVDYVDWAALDGDPDAAVEVATVIASGVDSAEYSTPFCASRVVHTQTLLNVGHLNYQMHDWCWDTVTGSECTDKGVKVDLPVDYWEHNATMGWALCPAGSKGWYKENVLITDAMVP